MVTFCFIKCWPSSNSCYLKSSLLRHRNAQLGPERISKQLKCGKLKSYCWSIRDINYTEALKWKSWWNFTYIILFLNFNLFKESVLAQKETLDGTKWVRLNRFSADLSVYQNLSVNLVSIIKLYQILLFLQRLTQHTLVKIWNIGIQL
jgi:hypothetical protein